MADAEAEVSLSREEDHYILRATDGSGKENEISLGLTALLAVLPLIQRECSQRLEARTGPGIRAQGALPIIPMAVTGFDVNPEAFHRSEIFLTLRDGYENHFAFALKPDDALRVAKRLAEKVRELGSHPTPLGTRQ